MKEPQPNPQVADLAPTGPALTEYDEQHMITYMRVFDADQQGADVKSVGSCCASTQTPRPTARD